jgi:uncharacterized membrane protein YgaE (UPF0421/DUF939 family)
MVDAVFRLLGGIRSSRTVHALKVAVAASAAWLVTMPMGGPADEYPYYAPLGAVTSMVGSIAGSFRATASSIVAIALGAIPAVLTVALPIRPVIGIAVVIFVGTWLSGSTRLGPMASWVPMSGLFILLIGSADPFRFGLSYLGLITLGAAVGLVVDALWPSLPLLATQHTLEALREELAAQMCDLADGLDSDPLPSVEEWREHRRDVDFHEREMHRMVAQTRDARRANWRAGRWRVEAERQYRQARALEDLAYLVEEAYDLVTRTEHADREQVALGAHLRPLAARALTSTADVLCSVEDEAVDVAVWRRAVQRADELAQEVRDQQATTDAEFFTAGSLVTTLRRALESVRPRDASHGLL